MKAKSLTKSRKGAFGFEMIPGAVISLGIAVFSLALVITLLATLQGTQTADSFAYNATQAGLEGLDEYNNWWVILVIASVFLIVFGLLAVIRNRTTAL